MTTAARRSDTLQAQRVLEHFDSSSRDWEDIYAYSTVRAAVIRERHALALRWIRGLRLPADARILEIGCGAGPLSVTVAQLGYSIDAVDVSERMVERARRHALKFGVEDRMTVERGDVHEVEYRDDVFNLVVALGLLPWLHSPVAAIREIARVTAPGGYVILSSDNRRALHRVLDPRATPVLEPMKLRLKRYLERKGLWNEEEALDARSYSSLVIDRLAAQAGLAKVRGQTLGFGPFSILGRTCLPESIGLKVHRRLQSLADRGVPVIQSAGHQYMLLSRKSLSVPR